MITCSFGSPDCAAVFPPVSTGLLIVSSNLGRFFHLSMSFMWDFPLHDIYITVHRSIYITPLFLFIHIYYFVLFFFLSSLLLFCFPSRSSNLFLGLSTCVNLSLVWFDNPAGLLGDRRGTFFFPPLLPFSHIIFYYYNKCLSVD